MFVWTVPPTGIISLLQQSNRNTLMWKLPIMIFVGRSYMYTKIANLLSFTCYRCFTVPESFVGASTCVFGKFKETMSFFQYHLLLVTGQRTLSISWQLFTFIFGLVTDAISCRFGGQVFVSHVSGLWLFMKERCLTTCSILSFVEWKFLYTM